MMGYLLSCDVSHVTRAFPLLRGRFPPYRTQTLLTDAELRLHVDRRRSRAMSKLSNMIEMDDALAVIDAVEVLLVEGSKSK